MLPFLHVERCWPSLLFCIKVDKTEKTAHTLLLHTRPTFFHATRKRLSPSERLLFSKGPISVLPSLTSSLVAVFPNPFQYLSMPPLNYPSRSGLGEKYKERQATLTCFYMSRFNATRDKPKRSVRTKVLSRAQRGGGRDKAAKRGGGYVRGREEPLFLTALADRMERVEPRPERTEAPVTARPAMQAVGVRKESSGAGGAAGTGGACGAAVGLEPGSRGAGMGGTLPLRTVDMCVGAGVSGWPCRGRALSSGS